MNLQSLFRLKSTDVPLEVHSEDESRMTLTLTLTIPPLLLLYVLGFRPYPVPLGKRVNKRTDGSSSDRSVSHSRDGPTRV